MSSIAEQLVLVRDRIAAAALRAGRPADSVRLLAVSKGHPAEDVAEAYATGQRDFGENYVQELVAKARALEHLRDIVWHAIGPIQRNKARDVCRVARIVHTVDRVEIAEELAKRAAHPLDVLIEVNVAGEAQKAGCDPESVERIASRIAELASLELVGLMAIPPLDREPEANRPHFAKLRALGESLRANGHVTATELSMGMSADFDVAIGEGATIVRVGTAIFGARTPRTKEV